MSRVATIVIRSGSMMAMDVNVVTKLGNALMDKGYGVRIFAYGEAATSILKDQAPRRFPNAGKDLEDLIKRGAKMAVCETCAGARGIHRGMEIEGGKVGSLTNDLSGYMAESDRLIMIAR